MRADFVNLYEQPEVHARRWFLLGVLSLSVVLVVMSVSGINVALPTLQRGIGVSGPQLQWIVNAYSVAFSGLLFAGGAIGDRYGRKGALQGGLLGVSPTGLSAPARQCSPPRSRS